MFHTCSGCGGVVRIEHGRGVACPGCGRSAPIAGNSLPRTVAAVLLGLVVTGCEPQTTPEPAYGISVPTGETGDTGGE